jgi:hypothetical protein
MCVDHGIQITFFLVHKVDQDLPRAFDHLELAIRLHLTDKVDHLGHDYANLVPFILKV